MVEQSAAASHAPANRTAEPARLLGPFSIGVAAHAATVRRPTPRPSAEPLDRKAFSFGRADAVKPSAPAKIDTWEEF